MKQNFAYPWKNLYQWYFTVKVTSIWHLRRCVNESLSKAVRLEARFFSIFKWCLTFQSSRYNNKSSNKSSLQIMLISDVIFLYLQTASKISWWRHYRHYLSESIFSASFDLIPYLEGEIPRIQGVYNINDQHIINLKTFEMLKRGSIIPPSKTCLWWVAFYIDMNKYVALIKFAFNSKLKFSCRESCTD